MKKISGLFIAALIFGISTIAAADDFTSTVEAFRVSPVVEKFFQYSYGYAVFPNIGKVGYIVGGSYGEGLVYEGGKVTGKSTMIEGSIGLQLGGKLFSEIIFFQDKNAYDSFTSGNFEFDATAQAVIITASGEAQAGSSGFSAAAGVSPNSSVQAESGYVNGVATFVHTKGGLMYELSIGGQKFSYSPFRL